MQMVKTQHSELIALKASPEEDITIPAACFLFLPLIWLKALLKKHTLQHLILGCHWANLFFLDIKWHYTGVCWT